MNYSKDQLLSLAQNNPKELVRILTNPSVDNFTLTYGVEILSNEITDETIVFPVLLQLLKHINATVREGAIVGISSFYYKKQPPKDILDKLKTISANDPSHVLRTDAKSLLEDFENIK